ncbi:Multiple C2 and transmembrane domain-containing protein [Apis cerana cerana]|uniref:Multiple C2 and transmembrane domain-containing protein n=1 Tax=Apis cerana cerana TaxID=94128 RepID=A0A2A3EME5_APICC|nr:Multiple C2 and transmembrane domain-containing protein [Apis cerana cerana]
MSTPFTACQLYGDGNGLKQWISGQVAMITGTSLTHHTTHSHFHDEIDEGPATPGDDDDDDDDKDKEEKKSLKERLQAIQEVTQTVQNSIGYIASLCERVKNLFNFTVPYLSYLAMILAILGAVVLYFIPLRYLILTWGVNKFSRKIVRPHSVPNNELLDLISRVPDDEELLNYRELKPLPTADCEKGSGSPGASNQTRREQRKRHKAASENISSLKILRSKAKRDIEFIIELPAFICTRKSSYMIEFENGIVIRSAISIDSRRTKLKSYIEFWNLVGVLDVPIKCTYDKREYFLDIRRTLSHLSECPRPCANSESQSRDKLSDFIEEASS